MISKEDYLKRVKKGKKEFKLIKDEIKYKDEIAEYYLKHEANIALSSQLTGISTYSSKITYLPTNSNDSRKVELLNHAFEQIVNSYKK
ncbi:MAG: hypothetical protein GY775_16730 [Candidatus Scalindua sp.]|nr:hypothetical protein [Candidatus Scalindua sp.]